ncbi:MAG: 50S ribosomal protein L10 [Gammaproteobacteria bacterium]|nr:50S ribosomal protein L10 [Gammaproteobacteria bacterium]
MALQYADKQALVAEVNAVASHACSAIAAEYRGLTVAQMTALRADARKSGVYLRVVKNTLARLAIEGTDFACMQATLRGPLLLAFSEQDPSAGARVLKAFAKNNEALRAVALAIGGKLLPASELERLASLPSREQALSMLLGVLQAPIAKLVRALAEPQAKLARTLAAVRDQKQAATA